MSKTRDTGYLANVIQVHDTGVRIMSGSTMLMAVSSSGEVTVTGVISGSNALSSSFSLNSALLSGTGSVGFATTGAFATASGSVSSRITQIEQVYATTGSNSFRATQSITGSLTVTGQIIAQTLNVQQVTSSIIFSTGSNTFGCDLNNRQTFTGSFFQTGSVAVFNSCVGIGLNNPTNRLEVQSGDIKLNAGASRCTSIFFGITGTNYGRIQYSDMDGSMFITTMGAGSGYDLNLGTKCVTRLTITGDGNVGIGCTSPTIKLSVQDNNTADRFCNIAVFGNSTPSARLYIKDEDGIGQNPAGIYNDTGYGVGIYNLGAGVNSGVKLFTGSPLSQRLWINACGIANFSCSVCAQNVDIRGILRVGINQTANTDIRIDNACSGKIHYIFSDAATGDLGLEAGSGTGIKFNTSGPFTRMYLNSSGNLGIGISCPSVRLHVLASGAAMSTLASESANGGWLRFARSTSTIYGYVGSGYELVSGGGANDFAVTAESCNILFATSAGTERMRIANTGLVTLSCMISAKGGCFSSRADARVLYLKQNNAGTDNIIQFIDHADTFAWEVVGRNSVFYIYNNYGGNFSMCINPTTNAVHFPGAVSKGSGTFNIEHPLDSKKCTHRLVHSFIEGPQADLIYRGKINLENGVACVNVDCASRMTQGTFEALNRCAQVFTTNESSWDAIRGKLYGNVLVIESENTESQDEISWMVIGERQDKHIKETSITDAFGRIIVEPEVEEQFTCICV